MTAKRVPGPNIQRRGGNLHEFFISIRDSASVSYVHVAEQGRFEAGGELLNFNTLDGFRKADSSSLLRQAAGKIWSSIKDGSAEREPSLLCQFLLLSHAELKSYRFYYW